MSLDVITLFILVMSFHFVFLFRSVIIVICSSSSSSSLFLSPSVFSCLVLTFMDISLFVFFPVLL